ncbi:MAG: YhjD/YihY/BrkB family envelope integrity protein [Planctomycetota bacterium]
MRLPARLRQLQHQLRALLDADNEDLPRSQRALLYSIELGRFAAAKLKQDRAPQMAAALTYHTLFSMLPTLVLTLVVAQAFVSQQQLDELKDQTVRWAVQWLDTDNGTAPDNPALALPDVGPPSPAQQVAQQRQTEYRATAEKLDEQLSGWLDQLQQVNFGSIGVVGVLIFIYGATGLLATIESSFNRILRSEENRSWYHRLPLYYTTLTLAPVVLLAGQWAQRQFLDVVSNSVSAVAWIAGPFVVLSPLLTAWLVLLLVYRLLPNASIGLRPAAIGSFVAALGLGIAVEAFALYATNTASTNLYGALALLPLFLLLLWIVWQIVLFGLEIASIIQLAPDPADRRKRRDADRDHALRVLDPRLIIPALVQFAHAFRDGRPLTPQQLTEALRLPSSAARALLDTLLDAGHIHPVQRDSSGSDDPARFALNRAPESIALSDLLDTARKAGRPDAELAALDALDQAERDAASQRTLADLL